MNAQISPNIAYFLIYNPTISLSTNTEKDEDEDAREEAHILFYTSQDQVTSKDRILRQVGLAKAIVSFSELFTAGHSTDNVHTQSKRMVSISPEPDFWMHVCVNLAKTPKSNKKSKERDNASSKTYYYHQESVPDMMLRDFLLQGYDEFKLLHGTFSSNLSAGRLQPQLERFFTPWTWRLDIEALNNAHYRLGPHVHPSDSSLRPIVAEFIKTLPSDALPILFTSSHVVTFSEDYECPSSLLKFLWSISGSADAKAKTRTNEETKKPEESSSHDGGYNVTSSSFFASGFGSVMNPKKWSWPGSLTIGKAAAPGNPPQDAPDVVNTSNLDTGTRSIHEIPSTSISASDCNVISPAQIDQSALDDAIATIEDHSIPPEDTYIPLIPENPNASNLISPLATSSASFASKLIYLPSPPHTPNLQPRQLLYMSALHSVFALVVDINWIQEKNDDFLGRLLFNTMRFLKRIRETLDHETSLNLAKPRRSDYILRSQSNLTYADGVIAKEALSYLNENSKLMQDDEIQEIFSRPQMPKTWFVSKRSLNSNSPARTFVEANFAINIKEASLIGANNEIESVVRHLNKR